MENEHPLIGKVVKILHSGDTAVPYSPLRILAIQEPFIQFGPVEGANASVLSYPGHNDTLEPFWMPIVDCKRIVELA